MAWMRQYVESKKVLYIGSVDDDLQNISKHKPIHKMVAKYSRNVLGIYHSEEVASDLSDSGLKSLADDVGTMELGDTFETIISAENLEHLSNYGDFLKGISKHLSTEGVFLVSSPNPASLVRILELLFLRKVKTNKEHTCWFTGQVLDQLAGRYGLEVKGEEFIDEMNYYHSTAYYLEKYGRPGIVLRYMLVSINFIICSIFPQFSETVGYVLKKNDPSGFNE
jgi:hypothetical protein